MHDKIRSLIKNAFRDAGNIEVEVPKNEKYGDYASNIAITTSKQLGIDPSQTAADIVSILRGLDKEGIFASIEATKQGFINFKLSARTLENNLVNIINEKEKYGTSKAGIGKKVLIEFVSANPTGPLHIGHGRWAVIGDCLANILMFNGYQVQKEYYVNDAGEQIEKLVMSIRARMEGSDIPEGGYAGSYVKELADSIKGKGDIKEEALKTLLSQQKETLNTLGVTFDRWFFETELHNKGLVKKAVNELEKRGLTFREGGSLWFKSSEYGDDKNRVLVKDDGSSTYFAADIAYHMDKFQRGYDRLINVWGTDHHGYIARLKAAMTALGYPAEKLEIIIGQLVALYRGKELIRMSKRTGEMITLEEVIDEIGRDATRYFLAKNSPNTHLDFDLELAKSKSLENPVYYVGYAHARICSIIKEAKKAGLVPETKADLSLLSTEPERKVMLKLIRFKDEAENSAVFMQPHRLTTYAEELAWIFHNYYHQHRVISNDKELSNARLTLVFAASIVLKSVLKLLGITAPEQM
jgi:arginyl-tRNA synthetase